MAYYYKPSKFVVSWLLIGAILVVWDATYLLFRPLSFPGGSLHWIWSPYEVYMEIDYVYGLPAFEDGNGFATGQAIINLFESTMNFIFVYTSLFSSNKSLRLAGAFIGLTGAMSSFSKTVLYFLTEYFSGWKYVGHNTTMDFYTLYILPSAPWIVFNLYAVYEISNDLKKALVAYPDEEIKKTQ
ncbi:uncharacterized protein V1516DRAFT_680645 [Lipomyces oligophaga]|uniref:uncharacterized protein n=1 Tax=Lipomyces oligophaga TaxID=45792 RepID=UPI0034CE52B4